MTLKKLRIGVLMGGRSIEREVSFNSGRTICDHLDTHRYTVIPLFQTETGKLYLLPQHFLHRGKITDFLHRLDSEAEKISWDMLKQHVDFVYLAIHGRYAEDGTVQGMLEVMNIPYLGTKVLGSAIGMNKVMQKAVLSAQGIDVPKGISLQPHEIKNITEEALIAQLSSQNIPFPMIVKPAHEGSSLGISMVFQPNQLLPAINKACFVDEHTTQAVLVEEKINGMEFVCVCLEKVTSSGNGTLERTWFSLPISEIVIEENAHFFDYDQKYMPGRALKITPARCSQQEQAAIVKTCQQATHMLGFSTISRIDGFLTPDGRVVIIDPNTLTGMSPSTFIFNQAAEYGMSHTDLINLLIENELQSYGLACIPQPLSGDVIMASSSKIRVAVLLGGDSNEREISLESGRNICYKLSPQKYEIIPVFVNDKMELFKIDQKLLIKNATRAIADLVTPEMHLQWSDLPTMCDFVFIALHGGKGENGSVQGALEMLDLPYNGSGVLTSALCINKFKTNNFLRSKGFDVPASLLLTKAEWTGLAVEQKEPFLTALLDAATLTFPLIIKPHDDGCSVMVNQAHTTQELGAHLDSAFTTSPKTTMLLEERVTGMELTCGVTGNDDVVALPPSQAVANKGILSIEEKFLPGAGENQTPAPLPAQTLELVKHVMVQAYKTIGCKGYARIDCFYQDASQSPTSTERVVLLECNTLPGMTPATCIFHQAAEMSMKPMDFIDKIVDLGFENHRKQKQQEPTVIQTALLEEEKPMSKKKEQETALQAAANAMMMSLF